MADTLTMHNLQNDTVDTSTAETSNQNEWSELLASAKTSAIYNTRMIFIAALELIAKNRFSEAITAANCINASMSMLIQAIAKNDISSLLSSSDRTDLSAAWCSLAEPVAVRAGENAALKFASLSPIVTENNDVITAANHFYVNRHWKAAATILGTLLSSPKAMSVDALRQLGICHYLSHNYSEAIDAFSAAIDKGDTSPETEAYITWLQEKYKNTEVCDDE